MRDAKENCEEREILGVDEGARGVRKEGLSTFALTCDQTSFLFCGGKVPRKKRTPYRRLLSRFFAPSRSVDYMKEGILVV